MTTVGQWLHELGLSRYAEAFASNEIDFDQLQDLTEDDLKELGLPIGPRHVVLKAIRALHDNAADTGSAAVQKAVTVPQPSAPAPPGSVAERRQLTVLFCDLVGSTTLATRLDPEDFRDVMQAYHACCAQTVVGFDGSVAQYLGDGVMVRFGYPKAHEDDAARAVHCGLEMIKAIAALTVPTGQPLEARVGIATGVVVVGESKNSEVGETPNLASRLQGLAQPGSLVIADSTKKLIGAQFECRDIGAVTVKGYSGPIRAWQVLAPSAVESRFEAMRSHELTPLVGRDEELDLLLRRWRQAKEGEGRVVLLAGEPGIGKSRLVAAFEDRIAAEPYIRMQYFFSPYHQISALYPIISQLGRAAGFQRDDGAAARLDKLDALLARTATTPENAALIADLLSLPAGDRYPTLSLSPQQRKDKTLTALIRQLEALACELPILMVFEDAHWSDPSSRELLDLTIDRIQSLPILLFVTFRPEFQPAWTGQSHVTTLVLNRLKRREGEALVKQMLGNRALPDEIVKDIVERTDGVPLFVEELTKSVLESGLGAEDLQTTLAVTPSPALAVPATLHAPLMARLDGLGAAKDIAQIGSAIGREFSFDLLSAVAERPSEVVQTSLTRLVDAGLIFQRGTPPQATYLFKHALIQDAAYSTLLREPRQRLHARIAEALREHSPETENEHPEVLAQHYAKAGLAERAAACWQIAGKRSVSRSASAEAIAHFTQGLAAVAQMAKGRKKQELELDFRLSLAAVLVSTEGWASPEYQRQSALARELADRLGDHERLVWAIYAQWVHLFSRAEHQLSLGVARELMTVAERHGDAIAKSVAHYCMGVTPMMLGDCVTARAHLERALALDDPLCSQSVVAKTGRDNAVVTLYNLTLTMAVLGYADRAKALAAECVKRGSSLSHAASMFFAQSSQINICFIQRTHAGLERSVEIQRRLANEHNLLFFQVVGAIYFGLAQVEAGNLAEGIAAMRDGLGEYKDMGFRMLLPRLLSMLATACYKAGETEEGLRAVDEALAVIEATSERQYEPELLRLKGELLLAGRQPNTGEAEAWFLKAIDVARHQCAKTWELRAATSLARLWCDNGRPAEARDLLSPVYNWFTEGFDLPDLRDAQALLDELDRILSERALRSG